MRNDRPQSARALTRRGFLGWLPKGMAFLASARWPRPAAAGEAAAVLNDLFWVKGIPDQPFYLGTGRNDHAGVDGLLSLMGRRGLKFFRSGIAGTTSGPAGLIGPSDVVLIKVNAQWKYRGATNGDVVRGLIERLLAHPDGFNGEIVVFENGQGRGSLDCDTSDVYGDSEVHANANDESHSFTHIVATIFNDARVSTFLLDPVLNSFITEDDHVTDGYRVYENVSYPCFTTTGGKRVELRQGIWNGAAHTSNLKLINVPVLKHHDIGGSEITASLKHVYGILSMGDGQSGFRHYLGLGETCGKMMVSVCPPVLNILDAVWVSHQSLTGYPASTTVRTNQILASQDPVALDYWAAKSVLYPLDQNPRHHPDHPGIDAWLTSARDTINGRGGLANPAKGIVVGQVTKTEAEMRVFSQRITLAPRADLIGSWAGQGVMRRNSDTGAWDKLASAADSISAGDLDGDGLDDLLGNWSAQGGVWTKSSSSGVWAKLAAAAGSIAAGDMDGDGRADLLGTWGGQGVFYRNSRTGAWVMMATPASLVAAGDLDGDGTDDLVGVWPGQGGVWSKRSRDASWTMLASTADAIAVGDMNGDGRADLVGTWADSGVFYRDSLTGEWVRIATAAAALAVGDVDGDGVDDLIGFWPDQGGVWVRYGSDGSWEWLSEAADFISSGRMRPATGALALPALGSGRVLWNADGPAALPEFVDLSPAGPGGAKFSFERERNLIPAARFWNQRAIPGPGEPGFRWRDAARLFPGDKAVR
jgi:hypothetical protein